MAAVPAWRAERPWLAGATICDGLLPWTRPFLPPDADLGAYLGRQGRSGYDHVSLTVAAAGEDAREALLTLGWLRAQLQAAGIPVAHDRDGIGAARADGRLSVSFHFQTATPFLGDLDLVDAFFAAGIRRAILAYNAANAFADGCHEPRNAGLSAAGRRLVERMDAVGMRVDISHCGERTSMDVLAMDLRRPPLFSHSNARALFEHERNITDGQIRAAADRDGYVGINGVGFFLGAEGDRIPTEMARHIAHVAGIAGAGRVGLGVDFMYLEGSDFGFFHRSRATWPRGYPPPPWSFLQPEQLGDLVSALEAVGFVEAEIVGILGGNYLARVAG
ncbi:MAG: membrane dipeptidase [Thalassobaculum sp.]|uniref:dipeptidase n=1 Tax=Thalassobaculum sp. TaxID=2022740 RepID=UPI0032ED60D1